MKTINGLGLSEGMALQKTIFYEAKKLVIPKDKVIDTSLEIERLSLTLEKSKAELNELYNTISKEIPEEADIFMAHIMILEDEDFINLIKEHINKGKNLLWAIDETKSYYRQLFLSMDQSYFQQRADDISDLATRLMRNSQCDSYGTDLIEINEPCILVAKDLTPSDTVRINREFVRGFITQLGGMTSHTAILARTLGIPAISQVEIEELKDSKEICMDGGKGVIYIQPNQDQIDRYYKDRLYKRQQAKEYSIYKDLKSMTTDGKEHPILCNIGNIGEVEDVIKVGAEGIGLFRTEFLFMGRNKAPSESEQILAYTKVCQGMDGKEVTIRTLDIGGDKEVPYLSYEKEDNPFLGVRGIRFCFKYEQLFKTQLRALLRVNENYPLKVMIPMITTMGEIKKVKEMVLDVKAELKKDSICITRDMKLGIMIETPSAVWMAEEFAKEVDFFSIGTNDLVQYTYVADRMNEEVAKHYSAFQPAVLRSIQYVVSCAHKANIPVSICGESASDIKLLPLWLDLGVDQLSVTASKVLPLRKAMKLMNSNNESWDTVKYLVEGKDIVDYLNKLNGGNNCEIKGQL